ncbi:MAG: hypothetical protein GF350_01385, partial [Chitinivibrionales bacterium]|nr:hypothetical protein [Chitinivibrionales bacterium]
MDQVTYTYDHASNRLSRDVMPDAPTPPSGLDELYIYDGLHRLSGAERGDLNANKDAITTPTFQQAWDLDALGNWSGFDEDTDGNGW